MLGWVGLCNCPRTPTLSFSQKNVPKLFIYFSCFLTVLLGFWICRVSWVVRRLSCVSALIGRSGKGWRPRGRGHPGEHHAFHHDRGGGEGEDRPRDGRALAEVPLGDLPRRAGHPEDQHQAGARVPRHVHQSLQLLPVRSYVANQNVYFEYISKNNKFYDSSKLLKPNTAIIVQHST